MDVGDGAYDIPSAVRRLCGTRGVEGAAPYIPDNDSIFLPPAPGFSGAGFFFL